MNIKLLLLLLITFSCKTETDVIEEEIPDTSYEFTIGQKDYAVVFKNLDWESAAAYAVEQDGYLIEINSQEEQDGVFETLLKLTEYYDATTAPDGGGYSHFWIGANDFAEEGNWVWDGDNDGIDTPQFWQGDQEGTAVDSLYNNWGYEPSNGAGGQDAGGIVPVDWTNGEAGTWNDVQKTNNLYFIMEYN